MLGQLMWAWLVLALGFFVVVPLSAQLLRVGQFRRCVLVVGGFAVAAFWSPSSWAANAPTGAVSLGAGGSVVSCQPDAVLAYVYTTGTATRFDGTCPGSGTVVCGQNTSQGGNTPYWYGAGTCYQLFQSQDGGEPTEPEPVTVNLAPFAMSAEDGALIAAAIIAVWSAAWGFRALIETLRDRKDGD